MVNPTITQLTINGQVFDLHNMTAEQGAALYAALKDVKGQDGNPTTQNYQKLADEIATLALNFQSIVQVPGPENIPVMERMTLLVKEMQNGTDKVSEGAADWIKTALNSEQGQSLRDAFKASGVGKTLDGPAATYAFFETIVKNAAKPFMAPLQIGNAWDALVATGFEAFNMAKGGMSPAQAKAYGAAYAASVYTQVDSPEAPVENRKPEAGLFDNIFAGVTWGIENLASVTPGFLKIVPTALMFLGNLFHNKFNPSKSWKEAEERVAKIQVDGPKSFEQIVQEGLVAEVGKGARGKASDILAAAENVAGVSTAPLASAIKGGAVYRANDGTWNTLSFDSNSPASPKTEAVKKPDGSVMTGASNVKTLWQTVGDAVLPEASPTGVAAYAWSAGKLTQGVAEGVARHGVGKSFKEVTALEKQAKALAAKIKSVKDAGGDIYHDKPHWWSRGKDVKEIPLKELESEFKMLTDKVNATKDIAKSNLSAASEFVQDAHAPIKSGSSLRNAWEAPRYPGRWIGDGLANGWDKFKGACVNGWEKLRAVPGKAKNAAVDVTLGTAEGTNQVVGAVTVSLEENASLLQRTTRFFSKWGSAALAYVAPTYVAGQTYSDVRNGDGTGAAIHGSETAAIGTAAWKLGTAAGAKGILQVAKVGLGRATPYTGAIISGGELAYSINKGDKAGMVAHGTELGTIAAFTGAGAALGAPFFGIGAVPGALLGATFGGIASLFTGWGARSWYESSNQPTEEQQPMLATTKPSVVMDPGIAAAMADEKTRIAQLEAKKVKYILDKCRVTGSQFAGMGNVAPPPASGRGSVVTYHLNS